MLRDLGSTNGPGAVHGAGRWALRPEAAAVGKTVLKYVPNEEAIDLEPSEAENYGALVGRDPKLRRLFRLLDDVAATDATVLIEGETGTGKELFAEEIHRHSPRKDGPFIVFDCGAVPDELIESALFGHVRGAFTGAVTDRRGALEEADGGHAVPRRDRRAAPPGAAGAACARSTSRSVRCLVGGTTYTRALGPGGAPPTATCAPRSRPRISREDLYLPGGGGPDAVLRCASADRRHPACWSSTSSASSVPSARSPSRLTIWSGCSTTTWTRQRPRAGAT